MNKTWTARAGMAGVGVVLLVILVSAVRSRLSDADATGSTQDQRVEISVPVHVVEARRASLRQWVYGAGNARAVRREYLVFRASGRVAAITTRSGRALREGDRVHGPREDAPQGELLASLQAVDETTALEVAKSGLSEAEEEVKVARATLAQAGARALLTKKSFLREADLLKGNATSREAYEKAETEAREARLAESVEKSKLTRAEAGVRAAQAKLKQAETDLEETRIYSPIDGVIAYKNLEVGWQYTEGSVRSDTESNVLRSVPFVVIDPSAYEIALPIAAYDATRLARGQPVSIRRARDEELASLGDRVDAPSVKGSVYTVPPAVDPGQRSVLVRIRVTEGAKALRDGDHVTCRITVSTKTALVLPTSATVVQDRRMFAYVVKNDRVERRALKVGANTEGNIEVLGGVSEGEKVVTAGRFDLYDGARVEVVAKQAKP